MTSKQTILGLVLVGVLMVAVLIAVNVPNKIPRTINCDGSDPNHDSCVISQTVTVTTMRFECLSKTCVSLNYEYLINDGTTPTSVVTVTVTSAVTFSK